eukprot:g613.t1
MKVAILVAATATCCLKQMLSSASSVQEPMKCELEWFETDLEYLTSLSAREWHDTKGDNEYTIEWKRPNGSKWDLWRWTISNLNASVDAVWQEFTTDALLVDSKRWTSQYVEKSGKSVYVSENLKLIYMQFNSGVAPLISNRDLCYVQCTRPIGSATRLASYRSVKNNSFCPEVKGFERLTWWGANLFVDQGNNMTKLVLIDQEDQGGNIPESLYDRFMARTYLRKEVEAIIRFFR